MFCLVLMLSQVNILQYFFAKNYTKGFLFLVKSLIKQQIFSKLIGTRYPNSCKYAPVYIMGRIVGLLHLLLFSFCSLNIFMFVSKLLVIMSVLSWEYSAPLSAWYHQTPARNNICIYPLYTIVYSLHTYRWTHCRGGCGTELSWNHCCTDTDLMECQGALYRTFKPPN